MDKKRQRAANYTSREKQYLLNIVYKYKNVVENKQTDGVSQKEKEATWAKIAIEFNAQCPGLVERSVESLKKYYENQKKIIRKQKADERMEVYRTGGGPPPKQYIDPSDELILSIINEKTVHGLKNPFDGDATEVLTNIADNEYCYEVDGKSINEDKELEVREIQTSNQHSYSAGPNKHIEPDSQLIKTQTNKNQQSDVSTTNTTCSIKLHNSAGPSKPTEMCVSSRKREINKTRRRPAVHVKALTTSHVAEKYSVLLENRIEISNYEKAKLKNSIEFEREEHELRKEALKLDILLKRKQCNVKEN